ncbi:hypothetical protein GGF31_001282 [Allomyces arbusculus]|nr:hypothetical protein GGF31_001282 [Allomyces arbusculus]
MPTLPVTTHDDKRPLAVPSAPRTGWRKIILTTRLGRIILGIALFAIVSALAATIAIFSQITLPTVELQSFAGVKGAYTIETNATGHPVLAWRRGKDSDLESPMAHLSVDNPNLYPIKLVEPCVDVHSPVMPWTKIASTTGVLRPESLKAPDVATVSGKSTENVKLKIEVAWNLTDEASSRVLTKGLLDCNLASSLLPPRLVAQTKDPKLDSDLNVSLRMFMVHGPFVRAQPIFPNLFKRPAKDLICPSNEGNTRDLADALCRAWGGCEVDRQAAASKAA